MICVTLVNTQTDTHRETFERLYVICSPSWANKHINRKTNSV